MHFSLVGLLLFTLVVVSPAPGADKALVWAFDGPTDKAGIPSPWRLKVGSGQPQIAVRSETTPTKRVALWLKADRASFFLGRNDLPFKASEYPLLEWSWKAITLPTGGDVRKSSLMPFADNRNDQAMQLLVTFTNGDVISYMWDSTAPVGTEVKENNPFANIMSVVVESGTARLGSWVSYRRNVAEDYRRLHRKPPPGVMGLAVQTNANHTKSQAEGYFDTIIARQLPVP